MGPLGVGLAGVGPPDAGPLGMGPLGIGPAGMGPPDAGALGIGPLGIGPLGIGPLGIGPLGIGPLEIGPLGTGPLKSELPWSGPLKPGPLGIGPLPIGSPWLVSEGAGTPGAAFGGGPAGRDPGANTGAPPSPPGWPGIGPDGASWGWGGWVKPAGWPCGPGPGAGVPGEYGVGPE